MGSGKGNYVTRKIKSTSDFLREFETQLEIIVSFSLISLKAVLSR